MPFILIKYPYIMGVNHTSKISAFQGDLLVATIMQTENLN